MKCRRQIRPTHPFQSIILDEDDDRFPPLYRLVLSTCVKATGTDLTVRWVSVVCGMVCIVFTWLIGREILGARMGLWSAFLMATCPFHIHYSREGRAYGFYFMCCCFAMWAASRLTRTSRLNDWLLFAAASMCALYSHYYAVPFLAVLWPWALWVTRSEGSWKNACIACLACALCTIPAVFLYLDATEAMPAGSLIAWFDIEAWAYTFMLQVSGYTLGPSMRELRSIPATEGIRMFLPWVVATSISVGLLSWCALVSLRNSKWLSLLLGFLIVVIPLIGYVGNLVGVGCNYRYVIWITLPFILWLGAGASLFPPRRMAIVGAAVLLILNGIAVYNRHFDARYEEEDFRRLAGYLETHEKGNMPILVANPYIATALDYYLDDSWDISSFPIFVEYESGRKKSLRTFHESHSPGTKYWFISEWLPDDDVRIATRDAVRDGLLVEPLDELAMMEIGTAVVQP